MNTNKYKYSILIFTIVYFLSFAGPWGSYFGDFLSGLQVVKAGLQGLFLIFSGQDPGWFTPFVITDI